MPTIRFITSGHTVAVPDEDADDLNLLRTAIKHGAGLPFRCASGQCGTDRVKVVEGAENLSPMRPREREALGELADGPYRLACQTYVNGDVSVSWDEGPVPGRLSKKVSEYWGNQ
jgi:ferredoxin